MSWIIAASPIAYTSGLTLSSFIMTRHCASVMRLEVKGSDDFRSCRDVLAILEDAYQWSSTDLLVFGCFLTSVMDLINGFGARPVLHTRRPNGTRDISVSPGVDDDGSSHRTFSLFLDE